MPEAVIPHSAFDIPHFFKMVLAYNVRPDYTFCAETVHVT